VLHLDAEAAAALAAGLNGAKFTVTSVDRKPYRRSPYAPFRTTTLQQEASRKLGFGTQRTMRWRRSCTRTASSPICVPTR
jgi:DNA topoisomerase-1